MDQGFNFISVNRDEVLMVQSHYIFCFLSEKASNICRSIAAKIHSHCFLKRMISIIKLSISLSSTAQSFDIKYIRQSFDLKIQKLIMQPERKKFQDIRKPLEQKGYQIVKSIGKGAFGEVVLAWNKHDEKACAIKTISKIQIKKKPFLQKYIDQEIQIMKKLSHPNIVKHQNSFHTNDFIVIVMEYCQQGNLLTYQAKLPGKTFTISHALTVIVEVMKGLKCIHQQNFIHRDIKSQNVLLKKIPKNTGYDLQYKIADFGFARSIGGVGAKTHCGTEKYMAPEIISNSYYGISVDLWALGVLFYFMLFAQYPFKGHDIKADIYRRCNPFFSLQNTVQKKEKLKEINGDVEEFFKKIFVIDWKKRLSFASMIQLPLFKDYLSEFEVNSKFYNVFQKQQKYIKDEVENIKQYGFESQMQAEDESRSFLLKKKEVGKSSKHLQRQLEEIYYEIRKVIYLKQCATQLYENYSSYLTYAQRLGARFYLLKAFLFYSEPLIQCLQAKKMPQTLLDANISLNAWQKCCSTQQYRNYVSKLQEEQLKGQFTYEDTYVLIQDVLEHMPIQKFEKGYSLQITEQSFDQLKFSYRSTTAYIFKVIHENKKIDGHLRNKIKMRLFCCHMINRIFNRKQINNNFPKFINWLQVKNIRYSHSFDFLYFKKWILEQTKENIQKNIALLRSTFF